MKCSTHDAQVKVAESTPENTCIQYECGCLELYPSPAKPTPTTQEAILNVIEALAALPHGRDAILEWVMDDNECDAVIKEQGWFND